MNNLEQKIKRKEKKSKVVPAQAESEEEPLLNESEKLKIEELAEQIAENKFQTSVKRVTTKKEKEVQKQVLPGVEEEPEQDQDDQEDTESAPAVIPVPEAKLKSASRV